MTVEAQLQVRELERGLRDRQSKISIEQDIPSLFLANCQLFVSPFVLQNFRNCIWTQAVHGLLLFPTFGQWSCLLI